MSSLLLFNRVDGLEIQSVTLVFSTGQLRNKLTKSAPSAYLRKEKNTQYSVDLHLIQEQNYGFYSVIVYQDCCHAPLPLLSFSSSVTSSTTRNHPETKPANGLYTSRSTQVCHLLYKMPEKNLKISAFSYIFIKLLCHIFWFLMTFMLPRE